MVKKYDKKSNKENNIDNNYLFNIQDRPIKVLYHQIYIMLVTVKKKLQFFQTTNL